MSEEKVLTLRGKTAVWAPGGGTGPIDPKRLPEGYPYKEQSEQVIEWDGNTEGLANFGVFYKVSDAVYDDLFGAKVIADNCDSAGNYIYTLANKTNMQGLDGYLVSEKDIVYAALASMPAVVVVPQGNDMGAEPGTYFFNDESFYIAKMTYGNETIHTMAPEFLPKMVVNVTHEIDGEGYRTNFKADKTYAEIRAAVDAGCTVEMHMRWWSVLTDGFHQGLQVLHYVGHSDFSDTPNGPMGFCTLWNLNNSSSGVDGFYAYMTCRESDDGEDVLDCKHFTFDVTWN